tara:strand:- start:342 stop:1325 length:984 start_codon:yes stop_codon:yes gene_type:complete
MLLLLNNKNLFKFLLLTILFSINYAITPYHENSNSKLQIKQNQNNRIRNINFKTLTSNLDNNINSKAIGVVIASWSLNTLLYKKNERNRKTLLNRTNVKVYENKENKKQNLKSEEPLTEEDVIRCQNMWANAIEIISSCYLQGGDFVDIATKTAGDLYGYQHHEVLFKPTKATNHPFRETGDEAMSYFVGADNFINSDRFKGEDIGFAINGGKGWKKVVFKNHKIYLEGKTALVMGSYDFTCATTGEITTAEFTFGYRRCSDGKPRIFLHHSSVPYKGMQKQVEKKTIINNIKENNKENNKENKDEISSNIVIPEGHSTHIHIHTAN